MRLVNLADATGIVLAVLAGPVSASPAHRITPSMEAKIDAAAKQDVASGHVAGAEVVVLRNGHRVFARSYGRSNLELGTPVNARTVFRIGSLTKQFTAAGVLLL